ncbi:MAG: formyltetrahydrofolate deformylase [Streptosporangiales bacterium]|nr:formyltetrahydrofolate deformylase [Streptosporangiales bacterium]
MPLSMRQGGPPVNRGVTDASPLPDIVSRVNPAAPALFRLLVSCPDQPGIVAAVSRFLYESGANIVSSAQYSTDPEGGAFFLRMEFALSEPSDDLAERFGPAVGERFGMDWTLWDTRQRKRLAILVSRYDHCLLDLLWRWRRREIDADIELVVSNHTDLQTDVASFGLPYHHLPVSRDTKADAEERLLELVTDRVDLVVLARYMQILSGDFLRRVGVPLINIHHSFLPAFAGAGPYERAKERGVKLVGATAHYVTEELDAGPIIEQDVARVSHRDDTPTIVRRGADIERIVLSRAVAWHCEDRVLVHGNTTVVFP